MGFSLFKSTANGPLQKAQARDKKRQPRFAAFLAMTFSGMVGALVVLASQTHVPQITRAPGTIIPAGDYAEIETLEGGIVSAVHVSDGQTVTAGELLVELQHPDLSKEEEVLVSDLSAIDRELANLRLIKQELEGLPKTDLELRHPDLQIAQATIEIYRESQRIQSLSILQQRETVDILETALALSEDRLAKKTLVLKRFQKLHEQGLKTLNAYLEEEDEVDTLRSAAADAAVRVAEAKNSLTQAESARAQERLELLEETLAQVIELENQRDQFALSLRIVRQKLNRLELVAPEEGIIHVVSFPNVGEVIAPGETLFELLPIKKTLVVEARIPNGDVGHVATDQDMSVTVDTFDARRFGKVDAQLRSVSPVPLIDEKTGETYFRASVELADDTIGRGHFQRPLQAGMTVTAEATTGEQTLLSYLLKPVYLTLNRTFQER